MDPAAQAAVVLGIATSIAAATLGGCIIVASSKLGSQLTTGKFFVVFTYLLAEVSLSNKNSGKAAALEANGGRR